MIDKTKRRDSARHASPCRAPKSTPRLIDKHRFHVNIATVYSESWRTVAGDVNRHISISMWQRS